MKKLFFAFPLLLAGCQSERVAFQFQPGAPMVVPKPVASMPALPGSAAPLLAATPPPVRASRPARPTGRHPYRLAPAATQPLAGATGPVMLPTQPLATNWLKPLLRKRATAGPAHTAESGLGGIGLFFIAVVLAVLAGLGALVSIIPGVSFWGGLGLAAAGVVVLFLLYRLFSGGKKK